MTEDYNNRAINAYHLTAPMLEDVILIELPYGVSKRIRNAPIHKEKRFEGVGRNVSCPCGSGQKHKHCCIKITK